MPGTFVGRDPELRQLSAARARVIGGQSAVFVVEGDPGIGKTRFLSELKAQAGNEQWQLVEWNCAELDVDRPFVAAVEGLTNLADQCRRSGAELPGELDDALATYRRSSGTLQPDDREDSSNVRQNGDVLIQLMIDGLVELARSTPTLLILDDAQWIDNASSRVLWGVAGRRRSLALLTVATFRPTARPEVQTMRRGLESQGAVNLMLKSLNRSDSEQLVRSIVGNEPDHRAQAMAERALREARGNPLFLTEMVNDTSLASEQLEPELLSTDIPPSLRSLISRRVSALPLETQTTLRRAALLGTNINLNELAVADQRTISALFSSLEPAIELRILVDHSGDLEFQHAIVQRIVNESYPAALRRENHLEIAQRFAHAGLSATRVGEHYALSEPGISVEATRWLRAAAFEVRVLSLESALAWSQRALLCCPEDQWFDTHLQVAGLLILLGRLDEATQACDEIKVRKMSVEEELRFRISFASMITMGGRTRDTEAIEHIDWVIAHLDPHSPRRLEMMGWKATLRVFSGDLELAKREALEAISQPTPAASTDEREAALCRAYEGLGLVALLRGETNDALRYTKHATDRYIHNHDLFTSVMLPHYALGLAMLGTKPIDEVAAMLQGGLDMCDRAGHTLAKAHLEPITAIAYLAAGQLEISRSIIEAAVQRNSNWRDTNVALPTGTGLASYIALLRDEVSTATRLAQDAFEQLLEGGAQAGSADFAFWCIANVAEAAGDTGRARDLLVGVWDLFAKDASLYLIAADLVRLTRDARPDFALDVVNRCEARLKRSGAPVDRANALASRGFYEQDIQKIDLACDEWQSVGWKLIPTRAAGFALELLDPKRDRLEIQRRLPLIIAAWEFIEAPQPVRVLRDRYAEHSGERTHRPKATTGPESLSQAERNVVRLLSEGLTNKEIAHRLYVSHRTVDSHVSHALAKLGCSSRVQLAGFVARDQIDLRGREVAP